jgi:uncharacterized membrane protein
MRNPRLALWLVVASFIVGLMALPFLPEQVPSHWNIAGEVDGYSSPFWGAFGLPLLGLAIALILPQLPKIDPRRENYEQFRGTYDLTINVLLIFFSSLHLLTILFAFGVPIDLGRLVIIGMGLMFAMIGNELGRVQPNYFMGIRTPWTLADETVWRRTHRVGGRMLTAAGLIAAVSALFLPLPIAGPIGFVAIIGAAFGSIGYSYVVWRQVRAAS